jgi:hypothetical protein
MQCGSLLHLVNKSTAMKQELYFHIHQPCSVDWDKMMPVDKGRFCASCNKQVFDFSLMSDSEVLQHFKRTTGKVCGRFANDQLQRAFLPQREQKKKNWWIALVMPLILIFCKVNAQKSTATPNKHSTIQKRAESMPVIIGDLEIKTIEPLADRTVDLSGRTVDGNGNPIPFASVSIRGESVNTTSDANGYFHLRASTLANSITVKATSTGYDAKEIIVPVKEDHDLVITLEQNQRRLSGTIVPHDSVSLVCTVAGGISVIRKVRHRDTVDTAMRKIFRKSVFKVYPNPVSKGESIHLQLKKAGQYSVQLLDNSSRPIMVQDLFAAK